MLPYKFGRAESKKIETEKGIITDAEFKQKLLEEPAVYQRLLNPITQ